MSSIPDLDESSDSLLLSRQSTRLTATTSFRERLQRQGTVSRDEMRLAMESMELELPADIPLASFTLIPSKTNLNRTLEVTAKHQEQALVAYLGSFKSVLLKQIQQIKRFTQRKDDSPAVEELVRELHRLKPCWVACDKTLPESSDDVVAQAELNLVFDAMKEWHALGEIGPQAIGRENTLYAMADALWEQVDGVIKRKFQGLSEVECAGFFEVLGAFTAQTSTARHLDAATSLSPYQLVDQTLEFDIELVGPIPYRVQNSPATWDAMEEWIKTLSECDVLNSNYLQLTEFVGSYLHYCWILHDAHMKALQLSIQIVKACYNLSFSSNRSDR